MRILLCEDNTDVVEIVRAIFSKGVELEVTTTGQECIDTYSGKYDVVLLDMGLPDMEGTEVLRKLKNVDQGAKVIVITASTSVNLAVDAMRLGAVNYIKKPFREADIKAAVKEAATSSTESEESQTGEDIQTKSDAMQSVYKKAEKFSTKNVSIVIGGPSGSGKEHFARYIHEKSGRKGPLVAVNCPAIPEQLAESILFGHEKGAFTGAHQKQIGKILSANEGTLFLDEVGDLSLELQSKLLRVLQERVVDPVGSLKPEQVDIRLICASSKSLRSGVASGEFREDLLYRLAEIEVALPALSERKEDLPQFVSLFATQYGEEHGEKLKTFSPGAIERLTSYNWPGNLRELRSMVRRLIILSDNETINRDCIDELRLEESVFEPTEAPQEIRSIKDNEKHLILEALLANDNNMTKTAKALKIGRTTLWRKMKKYGLAS